MEALTVAWMAGGLAGLCLLAAAVAWALRSRAVRGREVRAEARMFKQLKSMALLSLEDRLRFRELQRALPGHTVLAHVSLRQFIDGNVGLGVRIWQRRIAPWSVDFAVCAGNGRVVATVDVCHGLAPTREQVTKARLFKACGIRYWCAPEEMWPESPQLLAAWLLGGAPLHGGSRRRSVGPRSMNLPVSQPQDLESNSAAWQDTVLMAYTDDRDAESSELPDIRNHHDLREVMDSGLEMIEYEDPGESFHVPHPAHRAQRAQG